MSQRWQQLLETAQARTCPWSMIPTEGEWGIHHLDDPPHNRLLGPVFERGDPCGVVEVNGEIVCQWGDIDRADMTFSVTKTYLALVAGIAFDEGLIPELDERVVVTLARHKVSTEGFNDNHNSAITWRHFLQFTSEWSGQCFGVPDQIDHFRTVSMQPEVSSHRKGSRRNLSLPGTYWEYNDVRINQFSLALLRLFKKSLPQVFAEKIMQPLGASDQWQWHGYENSWVQLDNGETLQSVPGGGHWGGGVVISARDQLLVARLLLNGGRHNAVQILSSEWIDQLLTPCDVAPWYGGFTWLNTNHVVSQSASSQSYFAMGIGGQLVWHDPVHNLAAVFRWIDADHTEQFIEACISACTPDV